jgi:UDP-N-acetylglucosamine 2-epimerase (non-hydrolysing)
MLEEHGLMRTVQHLPHLKLTEPVGYLTSLALMRKAAVVLTDSGGMQEETTVLGVPCLTLRSNTERPITISEGTNELVGNTPQVIIEKATQALRAGGKKGRVPALWDGKASERIVRVLLQPLPV